VVSDHPLVSAWVNSPEAQSLARRIGQEVKRARPGEKIPFPSESLPPIY
jgi:hypothetical protein